MVDRNSISHGYVLWWFVVCVLILLIFWSKAYMFRSFHFLFLVPFCKARWARWKKTGKKITQLKWPKYQKPKDENMGWTKQISIKSPAYLLKHYSIWQKSCSKNTINIIDYFWTIINLHNFLFVASKVFFFRKYWCTYS